MSAIHHRFHASEIQDGIRDRFVEAEIVEWLGAYLMEAHSRDPRVNDVCIAVAQPNPGQLACHATFSFRLGERIVLENFVVGYGQTLAAAETDARAKIPANRREDASESV